MATKSKSPDAIGKVKFRVIEFELEGTDAAMQETIRGFTAALNNNQGVPAGRQIARPVAKQIGQNGDAMHSQEADHEADVLDAEPESDEPAAAKATRVPRARKIRPMKVLTDIRLDDVEPTLKEFAIEKAPDSHNAKYRVIAHWFKNIKGIPDLTPDHFFTAYRYLSWTTPTDPVKVIENLRGQAIGHFSTGATRGTSTINHVGEREVLEMGKA
ncbi:hypothetical protein NWF24_20455 [Variovorax paradoxus]|uniref:hypothetical protein n=1 Tax=Variovorax paradoxus TaxID=34073 RepID=UPI0021AC31EF|nr:hypothetical protein [Variovorax paradoxus]UVH55201.1 hypothetical protein NWF24_20455 [Variovorax paradoxus]